MVLYTMSGVLIWIAFVFTQTSFSTAQPVEMMGEKRFAKAPYCPDQILAPQHLYQKVKARSTIECMAQCRPDADCSAIVYDTGNHDCQLGDSKAYENCSNMEAAGPNMKFYHEPPPCGVGEEMGPDGICVCKAGFKGYPNCVRYLSDCDDVYHYGNWTGDGVYFIQPLLSAQPFQVYCRFITNARNYIMERRKNDMEFNRPWNDYVNGFGDVDGDHFLGLENIYALTNDHKRFELRVVVKDEANDRFFENPYKETKIGNAASGYPFLFNVSAHSTLPPVGCFQSLYGAKFSTSDRDNDGVPNVHCAALREGPWWYNDASCNTCNPTGPLVRPAGGTRLGVDNEVFWTHVLGNVAPFKVTMFLVLQSEFNSCWPNC